VLWPVGPRMAERHRASSSHRRKCGPRKATRRSGRYVASFVAVKKP
jgi:hypothetical protein